MNFEPCLAGSDYDEDKPLLVLALDSERLRFTSEPICKTAVPRGAVRHIGRWPAHVFTAFIVGCLTLAGVIFFTLITTILMIPSGERVSRNLHVNDLPNIYFIKHENHKWKPHELCYIETTARTHKNLTVYLINLLAENQTDSGKFRPKLLSEGKNEASNSYAGNIMSLDISDDRRQLIGNESEMAESALTSDDRESRKKLEEFNSNIKTIDVPIQRFFNGSRLAGISDQLNEKILEMAARAYVLWNYPGVALDPALYHSLKYLKGYLCENDEENGCVKDTTAAVEFNGDIQASAVPCQAFMDYLIRQIAMEKFPDQEAILNKAIAHFCPRSMTRCLGVRILEHDSRAITEKENLDCPTISGTPDFASQKIEDKPKTEEEKIV
ncbi:uncharacterized protein LOC105685332 isoform X2 [Athalia rosae]|uniref:uncharacterized protein LOC105685332 isoform X2 n=1 Tax=Athalia rosae TaxID=37344 RepID=UPI0020339B25|nr:uncharacterized protein LOC105685332 isoform X2 [Athalia rosae]